MVRLGGPQYLPPGQDLPAAQLAYRPRSQAAAQYQPPQDEQSVAGGALGGAVSGASVGTTIAPGWGTLIGGIGGALAGGIGTAMQNGQDEDSSQYQAGGLVKGLPSLAGTIAKARAKGG